MKKLITRNELIELIKSINSAMAASIVICTNPRMNKRNNPYYDKIKKLSYYNIFLGINYENSVNNQLERENKERNFESQDHGFAKHISKSLMVHKSDETKLYMCYKLEKKIQSIFIDENNNSIDKELLEPYLVKSNSSNSLLDKPVIFQQVLIDNIKEITVNGVNYIIN